MTTPETETEETESETEETEPETEETEPKPKKPEPYEPPMSAWNVKALIDASPADVQAKVVDCPSCPVFLFCQDGSGGVGYWCSKCRATAVRFDEARYAADHDAPQDILILDCAKHKFEMEKGKKLTLCVICSGGLASLEMTATGAKNHLVLTKHASVPAETRQKTLREAWAKWKKFYAEKAKNERKEKASAKKAAKEKK